MGTMKAKKATKETPKRERGKPRAYTPEGILAKFSEYVKWVHDNPVLINKVSAGAIVQVPTQRPMTVTGFCRFAEISLHTFLDYEVHADYAHTLTRIRATIEEDQLTGAITGLYEQAIVARVLRLAERQDVTTNGKTLPAQSAAINVTLDPEAAKIIQSIGSMPTTANSESK